MKRKVIIWALLVSVILGTGYLFGSATYKWNVPPGLTVGDILYADRKDRLTNLNAGSSGTVLQGQGSSTAPAYVAKNTFRVTSFNFANASATATASTDQQLCLYWVATYAAYSASILAPATAGKIFTLRNGGGHTMTVMVSGGASGTGIEVGSGYSQVLAYDTMLGQYVKIGTAALAP